MKTITTLQPNGRKRAAVNEARGVWVLHRAVTWHPIVRADGFSVTHAPTGRAIVAEVSRERADRVLAALAAFPALGVEARTGGDLSPAEYAAMRADTALCAAMKGRS